MRRFATWSAETGASLGLPGEEADSCWAVGKLVSRQTMSKIASKSKSVGEETLGAARFWLLRFFAEVSGLVWLVTRSNKSKASKVGAGRGFFFRSFFFRGLDRRCLTLAGGGAFLSAGKGKVSSGS